MGGQGRWCGMCRGGLVWGFVPGGDNSNNTQSNTINTPMINLLSVTFSTISESVDIQNATLLNNQQ